MNQDADYDKLNLPRKQLVTWLPNFDAGTLTLIITVLGGFWHFGGAFTAVTVEQTAMKATAAAEVVRSKEALVEMKLSVGAVDTKLIAVQDKLGLMAVTMAEIRATQQQRAVK